MFVTTAAFVIQTTDFRLQNRNNTLGGRLFLGFVFLLLRDGLSFKLRIV